MEIFYQLREFFLEHKKLLIVGGLLLFILLIVIYYLIFGFSIFKLNKQNEILTIDDINEIDENNEIEKDNNDIPKEDSCFVKVDIKGMINKPGLYEVECNKRVQDVINLANGLKSNANTSVINLGKKVFDEMVIIIYSNNQVNDFVNTKKVEEITNQKCKNDDIIKNDACICDKDIVSADNIVIDNNKISINKATKEELMNLSGIGESKANNIIKYREENGLFTTIEDLKKISGIGDSIFEKIKNDITL